MMKRTIRFILVASLILALLVGNSWVTGASFADGESSIGNVLRAWISSMWVQTTQADFAAGVLNDVDITISSDDVILASASNWYDINWGYRRAITIDHTKVQDVADPSTTYASFPFLAYATGLSSINPNGTDIRFTSSDGTTELPREIESYSGGTLYAWVKVTLTKDSSDSSDDVIYMYYGNGAATEPPTDSTYGAENIWDSNYLGVWHLNETVSDEQTSGTHYDATSNGNNGSQNGNDDTGGKIANGQLFDGGKFSPDYVEVTSLSAPTDKTYSLWIYANGLHGGRYDTLIEFDTDSPWFGAAARYIELYNENPYSSSQISTGQWYYVAYTSDSGTNTAKVYINGVDDTEPTSNQSANTNTGSGMGIGYRSAANYPWNGIIDEVRLSNVARSAQWVRTSYNNQSAPSSFCGVGEEETGGTLSGTIASQVLDTGAAGTSWDELSWSETLQSGTDITFEVRASDTPFAKDDVSPSWVAIGGTSPVTTGLPSGRYMQWRAILTTSDGSKTPALHDVTISYY